jgi:hypothetical protein
MEAYLLRITIVFYNQFSDACVLTLIFKIRLDFKVFLNVY